MSINTVLLTIVQYVCIWRNRVFTLLFGFTIYTCIYLFLIGHLNIFRYNSNQSLALILLYTHNHSIKTRDNICRGIRNGGHIVHFDRCPKKCEFSCLIEDFKERSPSAILFFAEDFYWSFHLSNQNRTSFKQRWIFWSWEAPIHHPKYTKSHLTFNWTMTYRQDSDIVHSYGRYIFRNLSYTIRDYQSIDYYLSSPNNQSTFNTRKEFSFRKNRILWFVSNCNTRTKRNEIAENLKKYFHIDQYGKCSNLPIKDNFEQLLFNYKFYLAFENAYCRDYITEKAFYNSLAHGSIPIVLGPNEENYKNILPPNSFIHIDQFKNLKNLADRLDHVSNNIDIFSFYHQWRIDYRLLTWKSNYFIDDRFCDLCIKLHDDLTPKSYLNFSRWLNQCI
ncbi:unnamed protein product [Rotaria sordida]|uniref:Fucosyltransferase n=1 Tax=Rotaria sordida TaxID=392033 RepID=A0A815AR99_9BILA|nr:unnamed protein product [Rotaria sordida]CAF3680178.1 unnamed protein product [Rotaria sordida]